MNAQFISLFLVSFLLGSIPFGKIAGNLKGLDIQRQGSGNIGFANSLRVLGWRPALVVLAGDVLKGFFPVIFALHWLTFTETLAVGLAAVLGHIFSPWLKFKGGKGVATSLGVSLAISPLLGVLGIGVWVLVLLIKRTASVSSLITALLMPILAGLLDSRLVIFYLIVLVILLFTHRANINKLAHGRENKIL